MRGGLRVPRQSEDGGTEQFNCVRLAAWGATWLTGTMRRVSVAAPQRAGQRHTQLRTQWCSQVGKADWGPRLPLGSIPWAVVCARPCSMASKGRMIDLSSVLAPAPAPAKPAPRKAWSGKVYSNKDDVTVRFLNKRLAEGHALTAQQEAMLAQATANIAARGDLPSPQPLPETPASKEVEVGIQVKKRKRGKKRRTERVDVLVSSLGVPRSDGKRRRRGGGPVSISAGGRGTLTVTLGQAQQSKPTKPERRRSTPSKKDSSKAAAAGKQQKQQKRSAKSAGSAVAPISQRLAMSLDALVKK